MKPYLVLGIICVVLAVMVTGCMQQPVKPPATTPPATSIPATAPATQTPSSDARTLITNGTWSLGSMVRNGISVSLVPGTTITAKFTANGSVNGAAGCNNYFGSYNITGNAITIGKIGSTLMFCAEPGVMDQESMYMSMLQNASTFSVTAAELKISDAGGKNQLIYQKYQPLPLTGSWKLDSMGEGGNVSRLIAGTNITAIFASDGNLTGSAGCNNYFGGFKVQGDGITISPLGATKMFCGEPAGIMDQESTYLRILQNAMKYSIAKNQLTFMDASGRSTLFYIAV